MRKYSKSTALGLQRYLALICNAIMPVTHGQCGVIKGEYQTSSKLIHKRTFAPPFPIILPMILVGTIMSQCKLSSSTCLPKPSELSFMFTNVRFKAVASENKQKQTCVVRNFMEYHGLCLSLPIL